MEIYFGPNLKFIREKRNISQTKMAEIVNVNQTTIARWEDENRIPTIEKAIEVSEALKIPLKDLIGSDMRALSKSNILPRNEIEEVKEKIMNLKEFDDNSKKSLISLIDTLHNLAINDNQDK